MRERIKQCLVCYSSCEMQGHCDTVSAGYVVDLPVNKSKVHRYDIFYDDYYVERYYNSKFLLRGLVTSIKAVFVDRYADENNRQTSNPNNVYSIFDAKRVDGFDDDADYQGRDSFDVRFYIIALEDVVITKRTHYNFTDKRNFPVEIDIDYDGTGTFYGSDGIIGDINGLTIPSYGYMSLQNQPWRMEFAAWREDFIDHIQDGYARWSNDDWLDWWLRGWRLAKLIKAFLPEDIRVEYGETGQCREVLQSCTYGCGWETNQDGFRVFIVTDMTDKLERGIYIENALVDFTYSQTHPLHCKLAANRNDHHLFPTDRVVLYSDITKKYYLATVDKIEDDGIIMSCDKPIDLEQEYSVELVI